MSTCFFLGVAGEVGEALKTVFKTEIVDAFWLPECTPFVPHHHNGLIMRHSYFPVTNL
jgi:hypothetical protein